MKDFFIKYTLDNYSRFGYAGPLSKQYFTFWKFDLKDLTSDLILEVS
jgi:hypothetical protein